MENMELYALGKSVPAEAKKPINAGRLKGFTDINPMWRIKRLTEMFGPCGIGWWYEITDKRMEFGKENEVRAFVDIDLFYTYKGETSKAIPGTGGSSYVTTEKNGVYVSDECFKMALTDAISVAAKNIGIGADVYYDKDRDKYTAPAEEPKQKAPKAEEPKEATKAEEPKIPAQNADGYWYCEDCKKPVTNAMKKNGEIMYPPEVVNLAMKKHGRCLCAECIKKNANK